MGVLDDRDRADAEALALELASARRVVAALRKAAARLVALALVQAANARASTGGQLTPAQQQGARAALNAAMAGLAVDVAAQTTAAVAAAVSLALRQEAPVLREYGLDAAMIRLTLADPLLTGAGQSAEHVLAAAVGQIAQTIAGPLATPVQLETVAARAMSAVAAVERNTRSVTNRAINQTTYQVAATIRPAAAPRTGEPPLSGNGRTPLVGDGLRVVWMAERDACLVCLKLSGDVLDPSSGAGFDEEATFGKPGSAPQVWPPGMPLMAPPRHPNCRCRLRIITADNTMVPAALKREAERSVARGWSASDSRRSRIRAADVLVRRANRLPRTVNERASRDVAAGRFSTRHRPRAPHLRAD